MIFDVAGKGAYEDLGMTELSFEGAEPSLDEFPLAQLLALFPEGKYKILGESVDGALMSGAVSSTPGTATAAVPGRLSSGPRATNLRFS